MFIEGATKDRNGAIRAECANGLGLIGPATFRTLLLVLHDGDQHVRDTASSAIVKNMTPESVNQAFSDPSVQYQRHSIICSVRELQTLDQQSYNNMLPSSMGTFMEALLELLSDGNTLQVGNRENSSLNMGLSEYQLHK